MKTKSTPATKPSTAEIGSLVGLVKGMDREAQNLVLGVAIGLGLREGKAPPPVTHASRHANAV